LVTAFLLLLSSLRVTSYKLRVTSYKLRNRSTSHPTPHTSHLTPQTSNLKPQTSMGWGSAFIIGIAQAIAVLPGLSRSGATIATGLLCGVKKEEVAKFSFLMVLIPILGETALGVLKGDFSAAISGIPTSSLLIGFFAAYICGCFACKFMIELIKRTNLIWFALYCALAGAAALIYTLC